MQEIDLSTALLRCFFYVIMYQTVTILFNIIFFFKNFQNPEKSTYITYIKYLTY